MKQAPKACYAHIDVYLEKLGVRRSSVDSNLYFKVVQGMRFILVLYVDDLVLRGSEPLMIECERDLASEFDMKDNYMMYYFMGL